MRSRYASRDEEFDVEETTLPAASAAVQEAVDRNLRPTTDIDVDLAEQSVNARGLRELGPHKGPRDAGRRPETQDDEDGKPLVFASDDDKEA